MTIEPIAFFRSPFTSKFGVPRQSGLVGGLRGEIVFEPRFRQPEALRGLDGFDFLWLIWGFSAHVSAPKHPTVRPPRLGGNQQMGVWATRSPFRPNNLGLSSVRIVKVDTGRMVIEVAGADLMDGTPVYDIKPYVEYADCHAGVRCGFTDKSGWARLRVEMDEVQARLFPAGELESLKQVLELDPRPHYHDDPGRVYGMPFGGWDVRFKVVGDVLTVTELVKL